MSAQTLLAGLDLTALHAFLDHAMPGLVHGELRARLLAGGHSNLTYEVADDATRWVLRRPPLGELRPTAHDMGREYRVMRALHGTAVPVPATTVLCEDAAILGAPFYLMAHVDGTVYRSQEQTATLGPRLAREVSFALVDALADLHALEPAAVGLGELGRPAGYLERQVRRWTGQIDGSWREIPGIDALAKRLRDELPGSSDAAIVHGDFRLDNAIVASDGRVAAVVDWELATLGDPLADLGLLSCYWTGVPSHSADTMTKGIAPELGFPPIAELVERYAARTRRDVSALPWYVAFGYFKLAVIREGIHHRYTRGETVGEGFERIGELVAPLVAQALTTLEEG
ncbi:MAG: putative phosphotransferase [Conexibacter sp.]|jgi:aminoglycoside phosphotransferase (APT) family kinase protein|nr:putative phosphotransferase [Conexibacter sp.]